MKGKKDNFSMENALFREINSQKSQNPTEKWKVEIIIVMKIGK